MKIVATLALSVMVSSTLLASDGHVLPYSVLKSDAKDVEIRNGGYGSAAFKDPHNKSRFYALTDRGPNAKFKGSHGKGKIFPVPNYTPRVGHFELLENGKVIKLKDILLKDPKGNPITGLPNSSALGGTGETPYDLSGKPILDKNGKIRLDDFGLDGEGLVVLKDGSFWVSDEYGPHIVHFDKNGREINRINAFKNDKRVSTYLPKEFQNRRANRGMEGLAITPDEKTLVGIMQSTMYNPDKKVKKLNLTRIVTVNLEDGKIGQYLYKQEKNQNSNSEITALDNNTFLVIERDSKYLRLSDKKPQKNVYKITLDSGTNIENIALTKNMTQDEELGLLIDGQTLEQSVLTNGWEILKKHQINPVKKELVVDLVDKLNYAHDKLEGLWVIDEKTLGVLNDDDFATMSKQGALKQKYLDKDKTIQDASTLYIIKNLNLSTK